MTVDETTMTPADRHSATRVECRAPRQRPPPSFVATIVESASARRHHSHVSRAGAHKRMLSPLSST